MRVAVGAVAVGLVAAFFALMLQDALGDDWPGWDEGWAIVLFPLGVPLAVAAALAAVASPRRSTLVVAITLAVWAWGGLVFALWYVLG
jgi:hypothetical protein